VILCKLQKYSAKYKQTNKNYLTDTERKNKLKEDYMFEYIKMKVTSVSWILEVGKGNLKRVKNHWKTALVDY